MNMISRAIVQSAIVLMNRRMKVERGVITFPSRFAPALKTCTCIISEERIRRKRRRAAYQRNTTQPRRVERVFPPQPR